MYVLINRELEILANVYELESKKVIVEWRGNTREFSKAIHGDDFIDVAKEFAAKVNGEVK